MLTAAAKAVATLASAVPNPAWEYIVGRKPITASHCDEYTAKLAATSQGPGTDRVLRSRWVQPWLAAVVLNDGFESAGRASASQIAMAADKAPSNHHQPGQPIQAMTRGPNNSAIAVPKGM